MTLQVEKGNLIELLESGEIDVLLHQTNCLGTISKQCSSGIAGVLEQYPEVVEADSTYIPGDINQLGKYILIPIITNSGKKAYICNIYSQYTVGLQNGTSPTSYLAMRAALKNASFAIRKELGKDAKIGMPQVGCGLGRADWNIVQEIIENSLGKVFNNLRIVTL